MLFFDAGPDAAMDRSAAERRGDNRQDKMADIEDDREGKGL